MLGIRRVHSSGKCDANEFKETFRTLLLAEDRIGADLPRFPGKVAGIEKGHADHPQPGLGGAHVTDDIKSTGGFELDIDQGEVWQQLKDGGNGVRRVVGIPAHHEIVLAIDRLDDALKERRVVFGDEDSSSRAFHGATGGVGRGRVRVCLRVATRGRNGGGRGGEGEGGFGCAPPIEAKSMNDRPTFVAACLAFLACGQP